MNTARVRGSRCCGVLSANSRLAGGVDHRLRELSAQVWQRWPSSGMPHAALVRAEFDALDDERVQMEAMRTRLHYVREAGWPAVYNHSSSERGDDSARRRLTVATRGAARPSRGSCRPERPRGDGTELDVGREVVDAAMWCARGTLRASRDWCLGEAGADPGTPVVHELSGYVDRRTDAHGDVDRAARSSGRSSIGEGTGAARATSVFRAGTPGDDPGRCRRHRWRATRRHEPHGD